MRGKGTLGLSALFAVLAVGACSGGATDQLTAPDLALKQVGPTATGRLMVTGSGHYIGPNDNWRTFAFTAIQMSDGTVGGRFSGGVHGGPGLAHWSGAVVCLVVDGDVAWFGAIYEHTPINPSLEGTGFVVKVVDHGEGRAAVPDSITRAMRGGSDCTTRPSPSPEFFYEVLGGNIQIHR